MDQVGIGIGVNLSGGTVTTHKESLLFFKGERLQPTNFFLGGLFIT